MGKQRKCKISVKLKKIIAGAIVAGMIPVMFQSGVNAEWKQSTDNGSWSYADDSGLATNWKLIEGLWYKALELDWDNRGCQFRFFSFWS